MHLFLGLSGFSWLSEFKEEVWEFLVVVDDVCEAMEGVGVGGVEGIGEDGVIFISAIMKSIKSLLFPRTRQFKIYVEL